MDSTLTETFIPKVLKSSPTLNVNVNLSFFQNLLNDYLVQSNESSRRSFSLTASARAQFCNISSFVPLNEQQHAQRLLLCSSETTPWNIVSPNPENTNLTHSLFADASNSIPTDNYYGFDASELVAGVFRLYLILGFSWYLFSQILPLPFLRRTSEFILSHVTMCFLLPIVGVGAVLNFFVRQAITLYFNNLAERNRHGERLYSLLAGIDSFWAYDVFANSTNFFALYVLEGENEIENVRSKIRRNVIEKQDETGKYIYKRLEFRIVSKFGYYCWENEGDFNIKNHIKFLEPVHDQEQRSMTESEVFEEMGKLCNVPCSDDKPQWEILVVPKYVYDDQNDIKHKGKKYYGLIFRFHHSFLDGVSAGACLQNALADLPPSKVIKMSVDPLKEIKVPLYKTLMLYLLCIVVGPVHFFQTLLHQEKNCFHGPSLTGPKRIGWSKPVDLKALKIIKQKTNTTTTAVLLSCLSSSVRKMAIQKGFEVPKQIHAFITVAMLPYKSLKPQNRFALALLPLTIGLDSCVERLKGVYRAILDLQRSPDVWLAFQIIRFAGLFPTFVGKFIVDRGHASVLLSNVPGPIETVTMFGGDPIVDIGCWSPIKGSIGMGMSLFSYAGRVRCSMETDHVVMSKVTDTRDLIRAFEEEVVELAQHSGVAYSDTFYKDS